MQMYPRVEPEQGGKIANRVSSVGVAGNRQPFLPSAPGGSLAHFPLALGAVLMVLCPALPRVIGKFVIVPDADHGQQRSEEHTSELQSLMRISYAVFCLKKKKTKHISTLTTTKQEKAHT